MLSKSPKLEPLPPIMLGIRLGGRKKKKKTLTVISQRGEIVIAEDIVTELNACHL